MYFNQLASITLDVRSEVHKIASYIVQNPVTKRHNLKMYKVRTIFTLILVSLQGGRTDELKSTECCNESELSNISLSNCAEIPCSNLTGNTAGSDETYSLLDDTESSSLPEEQPLEHTTNYSDVISPSASVSIEPPLESECPHNGSLNPYFYKYDDTFIKFNKTFISSFYFSPYYECRIVTRYKTIGNLYIKCSYENTMEGCPEGNLIFDREEELGSFWECSLKTEELDLWEYRKKAPENHEPHLLLHNTFYKNNNISNGSIEGQYVIVRSQRPYSNDSNGTIKWGDLYFERRFNCNVEEIEGNNSRKDLVCRKDPFVVPFQMFYEVLRCLCIAFGSATLLVFILVPQLRTMKTTIILCQTFSYFVKDLVDLRYTLGGWQPTYTECIAVAYNLHYWGLAASFWSNAMSIDLALTFRSRGFSRRKSKITFLLYSLYGWGCPLIITLVTAMLGFWVELPPGYVKPDINTEHCWFHTHEAGLFYHYVPSMVLSAINIPLLGYSVYSIIKSVYASDVLHNKDSGCHVGNTVKKESRTRLILYFNLALLIGSPKSIQYVKLFFGNNETLLLVFNFTALARTICMFLFVVCKKRVFLLMKKRLPLERLSVSSVFTSFISKSYDLNSRRKSSCDPLDHRVTIMNKIKEMN